MAAALSGCAAASPAAAIREAASPAPVHLRIPELPPTSNALCPITGLPVRLNSGSAHHRGRLIGFCSPDCHFAWTLLDDRDREELLIMAERNRRRLWHWSH